MPITISKRYRSFIFTIKVRHDREKGMAKFQITLLSHFFFIFFFHWWWRHSSSRQQHQDRETFWIKKRLCLWLRMVTIFLFSIQVQVLHGKYNVHSIEFTGLLLMKQYNPKKNKSFMQTCAWKKTPSLGFFLNFFRNYLLSLLTNIFQIL